MQCLRGVLVFVIALAMLSRAVTALPCAGDVNGDGMVTVDEIIKAVNAALNSCATDPCPGDVNGDQVVTIDEIIKAVIAALEGCGGTCPYTFLDDTLGLGMSCGYSGAFSLNPACSTELSALVLSDPTSGNLVAVSIGSDPIITFGAVASSPSEAAIVAYFVGDDLTPQPLSGVMQLNDEGSTLVIDPDTVPSFMIGGLDCSFDRYVGAFTRVVSDQVRRLARGRGHIDALRTAVGQR
ncbi:MAG TPA: hypothetical protein VMW56_03515 [Candidatus Margulisiibacteriota bacterium]|nr:hypothetical protein [Candidatus Margulisiibacteriota bacterium]